MTRKSKPATPTRKPAPKPAAAPARKGAAAAPARRPATVAAKAAEPPHRNDHHKVEHHKGEPKASAAHKAAPAAKAAAPSLKGGAAARTGTAHARAAAPTPPPAHDARRGQVLPEDRQSQLKLLIARGKEQGYLTYAQVNDHLPAEIVDPEQIEGIVNTINDMGIPVYEKAPDTESLLASEPAAPADDEAIEEAAAALAALDAELGRTTDPVRMYMREMGTVELLTREGRDPHRQAHRGRPRCGAHRARQVSGDARAPAARRTSWSRSARPG